MKKVLTYVYHKFEKVGEPDLMGTNPDRYMETLRGIVNRGWFSHVIYAGMLNTTCGGTDELGQHYGFILEADKTKMKTMLCVIDHDIAESFDKETMEKLDKNLEGFDEWFERTATENKAAMAM